MKERIKIEIEKVFLERKERVIEERKRE